MQNPSFLLSALLSANPPNPSSTGNSSTTASTSPSLPGSDSSFILNELTRRMREQQQQETLRQALIANPSHPVVLEILRQKQQLEQEESERKKREQLQAALSLLPLLLNNSQAAAPSSSISNEDLAAAGLTDTLQAQQLNIWRQHQQQSLDQQNQMGSVSAFPQSLALPQPKKSKEKRGAFPQRLHRMLRELEQIPGGSAIASFLPHGRSFLIHKPKDFVQKVMPLHFRMSRFNSFQRQLNLYDFTRITDGPEKGAYHHDHFLRDQPILATVMKRKNSAKATDATESVQSASGSNKDISQQDAKSEGSESGSERGIRVVSLNGTD